MKHFTVETIDTRRYKSIGVEEVSGGSRPRLVFVHRKTNRKLFFKTYSHTPREVWAETLASHIGKLVELPVQSVTIKKAPPKICEILKKRYPENFPGQWMPIGTLAHNIFPRNYEISYGAFIVETPTEPLTLEAVEASMHTKYYAPEDLLQSYADMVAFDAFIGNMDRHHENWGVCESDKYKQLVLFDKKATAEERHFAPLFDHGSSLMFELDGNKIAEYDHDDDRLRQYIERSKYTFTLDSSGNRANIFKIIEQEIDNKTTWGKRFEKSLAKFAGVDLLRLATMIARMPNLSELDYDYQRKKVLYRSLLMRYNKIEELYRKAK